MPHAVQTNKKINKKEVSKEELKKINILYKDIENTFQGFFGTKVKLDAGKRRGKIIIEYTSNDDLERILGLIKYKSFFDRSWQKWKK